MPCWVGVETFHPDGSFANTVGSLTTAIAAHHFAVPFYAVTELTKATDSAVGQGTQPQPAFSEPLKGQSGLLRNDHQLEMEYPPLERVPGQLVTAFLTERGVDEPARVWTIAR